MAFFNAFSFLRAEKKRKKEGTREPGRGTAGEMEGIGGGMPAAGLEVVPVVLVVVGGVFLVKVCYCTAFDAVMGGVEGYFCTD